MLREFSPPNFGGQRCIVECACGSLFSLSVTLDLQEEEQVEEDAKRVPDGHGRSFGSRPWQKSKYPNQLLFCHNNKAFLSNKD